MPDSPDRITGPRKEAILQKSPLLRAFLDPRLQSYPETWKAIIEQLGRTADEPHLDTSPVISAIFEPSVTHDIQLGTISMVAAMGYEIGDTIEAAMFSTDIRRRLYSLNILNTQPDKEEIVIACLFSILLTGAERRRRETETVLQEVRDFINNLDSKGS